MRKRSAARLAATQALYQIETGDLDHEVVITEFKLFRFGKDTEYFRWPNVDEDWFRDLVAGVIHERHRIDIYIQSALAANWPLRRINATVRNILRGAVYELMLCKTVPTCAIISEYVKITVSFCAENEAKFVNGVLDHLARNLRHEEFASDPSTATSPSTIATLEERPQDNGVQPNTDRS